jgi:hypothetical protein
MSITFGMMGSNDAAEKKRVQGKMKIVEYFP